MSTLLTGTGVPPSVPYTPPKEIYINTINDTTNTLAIAKG
jgi:hypothetical protein